MIILDLIFILISSNCVHTGTSVPSDIVGCASAGVPQILLSVILRAHVTRFQMLHIMASEPINISIKHSTLFTRVAKRHIYFKRHA